MTITNEGLTFCVGVLMVQSAVSFVGDIEVGSVSLSLGKDLGTVSKNRQTSSKGNERSGHVRELNTSHRQNVLNAGVSEVLFCQWTESGFNDS